MMFFVISCLLAVMSAAADKSAALRIVNDEAKVTMGKNQDVSLTRTGPGKLKIQSDVTTTGTLSAASLAFGRVTRFALDIDGKPYHPKCDLVRPAILKLGKFGGSNNHMGVYVDVKVYGSHRGGYHCSGADASHEVIQWHNCDRQSYRHYVIYGGDKSNSFTVSSSGNPKLVNLYDGKTRGDYINVATDDGVSLVLEQICGAYLDYTVVLEFHQRSATASGFQLDAGIATKQSIAWDSIATPKKIEIPIRGSQKTNANSLVFGQVKRFALDIDGKSYHPKCDQARPALLKLGKFGGSNNHMGSYMDIKVYGSHRGGYHCGGADASHKVAAWHNCDRQSYRHYVVYGGDKSNSFTVESSGNAKLVNLYDGKKRGDYINVATADGVSLVFEQICGAYLDYTVVLEFHHRSATASGFQLDAGIATKQTVTWDSIASSKKASEFPIRSRRRMTEAEAQASLQNEQISQLQQEVAELKSLVADLMQKQK